MPGLSYHRSSGKAEKRLNYFSLFNTDKALDRTRSDLTRPPKVQVCTHNPIKHKPCKPSYSQASWRKHTTEDDERMKIRFYWSMNPKSYICPAQCNVENGDGDTDLATMVHDFIENGCYDCEHYESSDLENNSPNSEMLCTKLQVLSSTINPFERDLESVVELLLSTHTVKDIACKAENTDCKGGCVRRFVAYQLKSLRYNAAICNIKWQNSGKVPGGEYEYIDVICSDGGYGNGNRIVIDLDFQSQFEIARPTEHYLAALKLVPVIFIGPWKKLEENLRIMSEAAKNSLKQNSMHLPPWRTLEYMRAKWLTPCDRKVYDISSYLFKVHSTEGIHLKQDLDLDSSESNQCWELVKHLKASYHKSDNDKKSCNIKNCSCKVGKYLIRNNSNAW